MTYKDFYDPASITDFLAKVGVDPKTGLSRDEAMTRRTMHGTNRVTPPVNCPSWVCCLLPCLLHTPSMQAYHQALPKDCTVLRRVAGNNVRRLHMDATSLVYGDVVELREGDVVGADLRVVECSTDCVVDQSILYGLDEAEEADIEAADTRCKKHIHTNVTDPKDPLISANTLLMATKVIKGTAVAVVYDTGNGTVWGKMVCSHEWPIPASGKAIGKQSRSEYVEVSLDDPTSERKALMTS